MPQEPNKLLRLLIPLGVIVVGIGVVFAVLSNTNKPTPAPATSPTPATGAATANPPATPPAAPPATGPVVAQTPPAANPPIAPAAQTPPVVPAAGSPQLDGLTAQGFDEAPSTAIGSLDPKGPWETQIEFSRFGAGIKSLRLARHFDTIERAADAHIVIQSEHSYTPPATANDPAPAPFVVTPLAAMSLEIEGKTVELLFKLDAARPGGIASVWREMSPGVFEAIIVNGAGEKIARVERRYSLLPGSFTVHLNQTITNLTGAPLNMRWVQSGPSDMADDAAGYGGDKRRLRFGYLFKPEMQRADPTVLSNEFVQPRGGKSVLGPKSPNGYYDDILPVWPNKLSTTEQFRMVWVGMTNRYFGAAIAPLVQPSAGPDEKVFRAVASVDRVLLQQFTATTGYSPFIVLRTTSGTLAVPAGATADVSMGLYAGPLERPAIQKDATAAPVGLDGLVMYNFGGMCGPCTFSFLTSWLLGLLRFLHANIVFDWALSIMVLVMCVRTILHPVTKWSQIRLQRFGKQMQGMAPKQKKIQEKYKDDPKKLREEMSKVWREEGVNPAGALGCLPMFLQTPVWIALYATLYFAFELRHQGAFFGVFQWLFPGHPKLLGWFLADLAQPDRFFYFKHDLFTAPILGPISSINVLPLILGVVFFIQQKYLTPPSTSPMTPEQEQQQKMVKWMMVFMFPVMMYNAPSGLALYFIMNSTLGILESRYIRAHISKYDLLKPKTPAGGGPGGAGGAKKGGFMARLQQMAEERQKQMLRAKGQYPPRKRV